MRVYAGSNLGKMQIPSNKLKPSEIVQVKLEVAKDQGVTATLSAEPAKKEEEEAKKRKAMEEEELRRQEIGKAVERKRRQIKEEESSDDDNTLIIKRLMSKGDSLSGSSEAYAPSKTQVAEKKQVVSKPRLVLPATVPMSQRTRTKLKMKRSTSFWHVTLPLHLFHFSKPFLLFNFRPFLLPLKHNLK